MEPKVQPKQRKRIQFAVPARPAPLDARTLDMIRRRRPTPASLLKAPGDLSSPDFGVGYIEEYPYFRDPTPELAEESEDDSSPYQRFVGDGHLLTSKRGNLCSYIPPSLKDVQQLIQAHVDSSSSIKVESERSEESSNPLEEEPELDDDDIGSSVDEEYAVLSRLEEYTGRLMLTEDRRLEAAKEGSKHADPGSSPPDAEDRKGLTEGAERGPLTPQEQDEECAVPSKLEEDPGHLLLSEVKRLEATNQEGSKHAGQGVRSLDAEVPKALTEGTERGAPTPQERGPDATSPPRLPEERPPLHHPEAFAEMVPPARP